MFSLFIFFLITYILVSEYTRPSYIPHELTKFSLFRSLTSKGKYLIYFKFGLYMLVSFSLLGWLITSDLHEGGIVQEELFEFRAYAFTMILVFTLLTIYSYVYYTKTNNKFLELQVDGNIDLSKVDGFDTKEMEFRNGYYTLISVGLDYVIYVAIFLSMSKGSIETITLWFTFVVSLYVVKCILNIFKLVLDRRMISQLKNSESY